VLFYHDSEHLFSIVNASNVVGDSEACIAGRLSPRFDMLLMRLKNAVQYFNSLKIMRRKNEKDHVWFGDSCHGFVHRNCSGA
jgi:hypothetical protein